MNKVFRILMNKSVRRVLNPKDKVGIIFSGQLLRAIKKYV